jgi:Cytochrome P460
VSADEHTWFRYLADRREFRSDHAVLHASSETNFMKIEWTFKKNTVAPYFVTVPDTLKAVATIEKDSNGFPDTHGWAYGNFNYDAASDTFTPEGNDAKCGYACHTTVAAQDCIFTAYPKR